MSGINLFGVPPISDQRRDRIVVVVVLWSVVLAGASYYAGYMTGRTQTMVLFRDTITQCVTVLDNALDAIKTTENEIHLRLEDVLP